MFSMSRSTWNLLQNCGVGRSWHAANFCNLNLTFISYSFWNIRRKVLLFFKMCLAVRPCDQFFFFTCNFEVNLITHLGVLAGHLGRCSEMTDTILEEDHPRIISAKFGWDWLSSFRGEDFGPLSKLCPSAPSCIQDGHHY
jgi:hypothetical protein